MRTNKDYENYRQRARVYCPSCKKYVKKKFGYSGKIWCSECNHLIKGD